MGLAKCSVPGCEVNLLPRHRFPKPNKDLLRLEEWRRLIQNPLFANLSPQELHEKKVCHRHFEEKYFSPGAKRLHLNAIPSLYLPSHPTKANDQPSTSNVGNEVLSLTAKCKTKILFDTLKQYLFTCAVDLGSSSDQALIRCETPKAQKRQ